MAVIIPVPRRSRDMLFSPNILVSCDGSVVVLVKYKRQGPLFSSPRCCFHGGDHFGLFSVVVFMDLVVGCPIILSIGFSAMISCTVSRLVAPGAEEKFISYLSFKNKLAPNAEHIFNIDIVVKFGANL